MVGQLTYFIKKIESSCTYSINIIIAIDVPETSIFMMMINIHSFEWRMELLLSSKLFVSQLMP